MSSEALVKRRAPTPAGGEVGGSRLVVGTEVSKRPRGRPRKTRAACHSGEQGEVGAEVAVPRGVPGLDVKGELCGSLRNPSSRECGNGCEGEDSLATHWCSFCQKALCWFCVSAHSRIPAMKQHTLSKIAAQQCGNGCESEDSMATHWCSSCQKALCCFCVTAHSRIPAMKQHTLSKIAASDISRNEAWNNYGSTSADVCNAGGCGSAPSQSRASHYAADGTQAKRDREQQVKRVAILLASFASEAGAAAVAAVAARQEAAADVAPHADGVARAAKAKTADALKQQHVHKAGGSAAIFQGPNKKIRQQEDFNQAQRKRLVEVYDMEESHRPDIDQLAKELDQIEGGRHVDAAAVKIWIMNRYHSLKRTAGGKAQVESYAQKQGDANKVAVWPSHAPALVGGVNDTWNSFQCASKGRKVTTAERKAAQGELLLWEEHPKAEAAAQGESDGDENDSKNESEGEDELDTAQSWPSLSLLDTAQVLDTSEVATNYNPISKTSNGHRLSGGAKVNTHVHASMGIGCRPQRARKQVERIRSSELISFQRAQPLLDS